MNTDRMMTVLLELERQDAAGCRSYALDDLMQLFGTTSKNEKAYVEWIAPLVDLDFVTIGDDGRYSLSKRGRFMFVFVDALIEDRR